MLISHAARPGGHLKNKGRFLLGLLTTYLPIPVKRKQEKQSLSGTLHKIKSFILYG